MMNWSRVSAISMQEAKERKKECIIEVFDYSGHSIAKYIFGYYAGGLLMWTRRIELFMGITVNFLRMVS